MTTLQWLGVGLLVLVVVLAGCYVWAMRRALNTISDWDREDDT